MQTNLFQIAVVGLLTILGMCSSPSVMAEAFDIEKEDYFQEVEVDNTFISSDNGVADESIQKVEEEDVDNGSIYLGDVEHSFIEKNKKIDPSKIVPLEAEGPSVLEGEVREGLNPRRHSSIRGMESVSVPSNYVNVSNKEMIKKVTWKTDSAFGLTYYAADNYEYHDSGNVYNKIFRDGTKSKNPGLLLFSNSKYFARGFLDLKWGINVGAKYNSGHGLFPNGATSDTRFSLWSIPVDLSLGFDIPISRFLKFSASAGPSAMGLIQSRDDRDYGEKGKHNRQVGTGYFASAQALIGLSSIFPKYGVEMYTDYSVGQTQLSIEGRMVKYQNFQDDITVDGTSFGVGIIFEFL
ncbi:MAG: hypothetical protein A2X86_17880 [Bdellovibrionales bacterium GWA2_49_15]|nr:MAG: hypothetical protein A2X86_17880 [Bdellovibrionales bacterium GWA2_49_15]